LTQEQGNDGFSAAPFLFLFDISDQCQRVTAKRVRVALRLFMFLDLDQADHCAKPAAQKKSSNP
jgi:hypothetical protein